MRAPRPSQRRAEPARLAQVSRLDRVLDRARPASQPPAAIASPPRPRSAGCAANVAPSRIANVGADPASPRTSLGEVPDRLEPFGRIVVDGRHLAPHVRVLHDEVRRPGEEPSVSRCRSLPTMPSSGASSAHARAVTLRDQLVVEPQAETGHVGVGEKAVDAATRVVADVEHRVHPVRAEIECVPRLEPGAGRQDSGVTLIRLPP